MMESKAKAHSLRPVRRRVPPPLPGAPSPPKMRFSWGRDRRRKPTEGFASDLLTPEELERFKDLLVFARTVVEGYFIGKHRSPHRGSSVEFADYKEYVPGDETNRIDWRAYGRLRRLFIRRHEAETDMVVYLMVDVSASMKYGGPGRRSKYHMAARIAAALAYLMMHQGDQVSLVLFAETVRRFLPPSGTRRHLHEVVTELERVEPSSTTGLGRALHECVSLFKKRGRLVVLSDFWDDTGDFLDALGQFLHRKFEILLLQIMDTDEMNLPAVHAARFQDMETGELVEVEPEEIRAGYRANVREQIETLAREAIRRRINHTLVDTERPYLDAIEAYLGFRGKNSFR